MMAGLGIKLARFAIVLAIFALWEILSRTGTGQSAAASVRFRHAVHAGRSLAARQRPQRSGRDRQGSADRLRARRSRRRPDRIFDRGAPLLRRRDEAAAVLRLQHSEIDLPADVHPGVRGRICPEGRIRLLLDDLHRHHVDDDRGRVRQGRASQGRPLLWRDRNADRVRASTCRACSRCCWRRCGFP